jgi:hypothetical protein
VLVSQLGVRDRPSAAQLGRLMCARSMPSRNASMTAP